jgi:hypothetical protein
MLKNYTKNPQLFNFFLFNTRLINAPRLIFIKF